MSMLNNIKQSAKKTVMNTVVKRVGIELTVVSTEQISKNIKRMMFLDTSHKLTTDHESGYLKLQFTDSTGDKKMRSYTIRKVDELNHHVMIDFVTHDIPAGEHAPAAHWASKAKQGDTLMAIGPGANKLTDNAMDWFFIVGDMTSLPAISVNLKQLPDDAKGYVIIEVGDESDIQELEKPVHVEIEWVINSDSIHSVKHILPAVKQKEWLVGTPYIWVASEFDTARALRQYFREVHDITQNRYISSYWKQGESDEGNKRAKKRDGGF